MEQVIVGLFTEVKRHKPSVIYIPSIDSWYATLRDTVGYVTFRALLKSIPPTDPILVLATAEYENGETIDPVLWKDIFAYSSKNKLEIARPKAVRCTRFSLCSPDFLLGSKRSKENWNNLTNCLNRRIAGSISSLYWSTSARAQPTSRTPPKGRSECWRSYHLLPRRRRGPLQKRKKKLHRRETVSFSTY